MSQLASRFKQTTRSLTTSLIPWSVFLDVTSLSLPPSIADATTRMTQNLTHFRVNYSLILLITLCLTLINHPLTLIAFLVVILAWVFLYFVREDEEEQFQPQPLRVFGYPVGNSVVLVTLLAATLLVVAWGGVWVNVIVGVAVGGGLVILHALIRSTDDLVANDFEVSPYSNLLSDEESSPVGRGGL